MFFFLTSSVYTTSYLLPKLAVNESVELFRVFHRECSIVKYGREWFVIHLKKKLHCVKYEEREACVRIMLKWIIHDLLLTVMKHYIP